MRVVEIETQDHKVRYVVMDEEGKLVGPIVQYLKYLDRIGSARQTLRSYAAALRQYWEFVSQEQFDWQHITLDELSRFVLWLKLPSGSLKVLPAHPVEQARSNRTINHTLTVVRGFYDYHWRTEEVSTNMKERTTTFLPARARRYKGFLHHITKGSPVAKNILKQKEEQRQRPKTITKDQVQELLNACVNERDRLLVHLLYESAMRVGEALSLFVEDVDIAENRVHIRDRGELPNGAEIKTVHAPRSIDVSSDLIDEIVAYVGRAHTAEVETNHLFIKLHGKRAGQALTYADVDSLFRRLRQKTGLDVTPHILRHSLLTRLGSAWVATRVAPRASWSRFFSADLSDVCAPFLGGASGCMGADARACVPQFSCGREIIMEPLGKAGVDGTGALASLSGIEEEFAKDRWDARHIPGLRYARHTGEYHINFAEIAKPFCSYVKDYARFLIASDRAVKTIATHVRYLRQFFFFFCQRYPQARSLQDLREQDIDAFILSLQVYLHEHRGKNEGAFVWRHIHTVEAFLAYLERIESPIKPQASTPRIIWPHHYPQQAWQRSQEVKYIPQIVLKQLDTDAQDIPPTYIPVVLLLRASGWRISDVLSLQLETCLEQAGDKCWLIGDIQLDFVHFWREGHEETSVVR